MKEIKNIFFEELDSTNDYAKRNLSSFDTQKITCITTNYQKKGKGRFNRKWIAKKGKNLLTTFYFQFPFPLKNIGTISLLACISICKILEKIPVQPKIKWPNDVQVNEKKIAGILCEVLFSKTSTNIILGVGLNVNADEKDLSLIDQPATSLFIETKKLWNIKEFLKNLQQEFIQNLEDFEKKGFKNFLSIFNKFLAYKEKTLHFYDGENIFRGHIDSITEDGGLKFLVLTTKEIKTFYSGEIISVE